MKETLAITFFLNPVLDCLGEGEAVGLLKEQRRLVLLLPQFIRAAIGVVIIMDVIVIQYVDVADNEVVGVISGAFSMGYKIR